VSKADDLEYARWHVVSAALSHVGEDIAYHRRRKFDWAADFGRALDQYVVVATGEIPQRKAGLRVVSDPLGNRIMRASLVFALASWRPEFAEWGPLPDAVAARRTLNAALKAYVESVTSRFAH
jgi:hypothetical protein